MPSAIQKNPAETDFGHTADDHYRGEAGASYQHDRHAIPDAAYSWLAAARAKKFAAYIRPDDVVVEYGAGYGWNLANLKCRRRIGYDIAEAVAPILKEHGIEFASSTHDLDEGMANVVICHHVLEHVANPLEILSDIRRLLAPGGKLLMVVPYEINRHFKRYTADDPHHHLYSWNPQTLGNLLTQAGFSPSDIRIQKFGYDRFAAVLANRLRLGEPGFRAIIRFGRLVRPWYEVRAVAVKESQK